ncbi:MAG TPA: carbohydrate-binding family 9-like protein [Tepidisphaeraceae bacterium]|nr:carbohydrate-binding family 9-like protein [Tepidisphaeraceae bacterium]
MLLVLGATSQPARDLPPTYACARTVAKIQIDGALDDAAWDSAGWTEDFIDIVGTSKPPPAHRTRAKLLWDEQFLYVAAEMIEPRVEATIRQRDKQLYTEQAFELFLDLGADGRNYLELQINPLNTVCDLAMDRPYRKNGKASVAFDLDGLRCAGRVQGTVNDASDADGGWTIELALPWADIKALSDDTVAPPREGQRWRANFARMRPDDAQHREAAEARRELSVWSAQGAINLHLPERWGWVEFVAAKPADANRADANRADVSSRRRKAQRAKCWRLRSRREAVKVERDACLFRLPPL